MNEMSKIKTLTYFQKKILNSYPRGHPQGKEIDEAYWKAAKEYAKYKKISIHNIFRD